MALESIKDSGKMVEDMEKECSNTSKMEILTQDGGSSERRMERELITPRLSKLFMASGKMEK